MDKLGDHLRTSGPSLGDLKDLDLFRRSYSPAYQLVIGRLTNILDLQPTGRPYKSVWSIVEKLRREKIRLSQMQDIAGCRIIVSNTFEQNWHVQQIRMILGDIVIDDRRVKSSHGYRAVHAICNSVGRPIEIQVRTTLQHQWAELSEKLSDTFDQTIKYGGGPKEIRNFLKKLTELVASVESFEIATEELVRRDPSQLNNKKRRKELKRASTANDGRKRQVHNLLREIQRSLTTHVNR